MVDNRVCKCHGRTFRNPTGRVLHEQLVGKPGTWLGKHLSPDHRQRISKTLTGYRHSAETRKRMSEVKLREKHPRWVGDKAGYKAQHRRAGPDFPDPLGQCQIPGCPKDAIDRARIDHTNLIYRPELVMPMCRSHNIRHRLNNFLIIFEAGEEQLSRAGIGPF